MKFILLNKNTLIVYLKVNIQLCAYFWIAIVTYRMASSRFYTVIACLKCIREWCIRIVLNGQPYLCCNFVNICLYHTGWKKSIATKLKVNMTQKWTCFAENSTFAPPWKAQGFMLVRLRYICFAFVSYDEYLFPRRASCKVSSMIANAKNLWHFVKLIWSLILSGTWPV